MPRFLRVLTGDAKVATKADKATAHAQWTCTGFLNRVVTDKYPLCPRGSRVVRIHDFPGCWDGTNTDTEDHRSHMAFARRTGECPQGFTAVPQLRIVLSYRVPSGASYAVDGFADQQHNPITDHDDFINVMPERLMNAVVRCINTGTRC